VIALSARRTLQALGRANLDSVMRLGILGPANGDLQALENAARCLLFDQAAEKAIYLGPDDALDRLVVEWAKRLVGDDPSDQGVFGRAAKTCGGARPEGILAHVANERARERLKSLRCLPAAESRTVEIVDGRVAVLLYDKALLDEEDILPAAVLVFGKNDEPLVRQVGPRTFVSPGQIRAGKGGAALLSDGVSGELGISIFEPGGKLVAAHPVAMPRTGKLRVVGDKAPGQGDRP
jgi:hypothetical protein